MSDKDTSYTEFNPWCWILSWFGKRVRGTVTLGCGDDECGHQHTITIWQKPGEDTWEVIQSRVQRAFERKQK